MVLSKAALMTETSDSPRNNPAVSLSARAWTIRRGMLVRNVAATIRQNTTRERPTANGRSIRDPSNRAASMLAATPWLSTTATSRPMNAMPIEAVIGPSRPPCTRPNSSMIGSSSEPTAIRQNSRASGATVPTTRTPM